MNANGSGKVWLGHWIYWNMFHIQLVAVWSHKSLQISSPHEWTMGYLFDTLQVNQPTYSGAALYFSSVFIAHNFSSVFIAHTCTLHILSKKEDSWLAHIMYKDINDCQGNSLQWQSILHGNLLACLHILKNKTLLENNGACLNPLFFGGFKYDWYHFCQYRHWDP